MKRKVLGKRCVLFFINSWKHFGLFCAGNHCPLDVLLTLRNGGKLETTMSGESANHGTRIVNVQNGGKLIYFSCTLLHVLLITSMFLCYILQLCSLVKAKEFTLLKDVEQNFSVGAFERIRDRRNFVWLSRVASKLCKTAIGNGGDAILNVRALAEFTLMPNVCNYGHIAAPLAAKELWHALISANEKLGYLSSC
uniref:Uncharacterized protein n=1 Tax=Glossina pallidipes TaxID=7398 RepID=A0A1B0A1F6_GLOPL